MGMDVEKEQSEALRRALQAVRSRDDFIATAAHELRTPMNALALQLELAGRLLDRGQLERGRAELDRAQRILQRFLRRSTTLLDVSRLNEQPPTLAFETFDLVKVLAEVTEDLRQDAVAHRVELVVDAPPALDVRWNRHGIEIVLSNLLSNALRYAPGQPVSLCAGAASADHVAITVADRGPGIDAADRERVFAKFEQLGRSDGLQSGFGLGLWIVGRVVAAHRGVVSIGDVPGGGTCFTVKLPRDPLVLPTVCTSSS